MLSGFREIIGQTPDGSKKPSGIVFHLSSNENPQANLARAAYFVMRDDLTFHASRIWGLFLVAGMLSILADARSLQKLAHCRRLWV